MGSATPTEFELPQVEKSEVLLTLAMPTYLIKQTQTHTVCFPNIL